MNRAAAISTLVLIALLLSNYGPLIGNDASRSFSRNPGTSSDTTVAHALTSSNAAPCWAVSNTICVSIDTRLSSSDNVVPQSPVSNNANYTHYPNPGDNIFFDVYSEYNLTQLWNGTPGAGEFTGYTSFLYLSVTDVEWNGVSWFCQCDNTVWHANAGNGWAPLNSTSVNKAITEYYPDRPGAPCTNLTGSGTTHWYDCNLPAHYVYMVEIQGQGANQSGNNFPAGAYVQWNVTSTSYTKGTQIQHVNTTSALWGGPFNYYVRKAWYWSDASPIGCSVQPSSQVPPCYPNTPGLPNANSSSCKNPNGNLSAAAFGCNLNVVLQGQPTIGANIVVNLSTSATWQKYSGAAINLATLYLTAYYSNGTFWMNWYSGFRPGSAGWPTTNASVTIPSGFFQNAGDTVNFYIVAYDQGSDPVQSANYTEVTNSNGIFPSVNFTTDLNLTTTPPAVGNEGPNGTLKNGTVPLLQLGQQMNLTIISVNPSVSIQGAWAYLRITFELAGYTQTAVESMHKYTLTDYYLNMPQLPMDTNVSFYVKAWDFNGSTVSSHIYKYIVPEIKTSPGGGSGFFYVEVFDNGSKTYVTGANVSIIGAAGTVKIDTATVAGIAYPNATGQQFTPQFLPANTTYSITVTWSKFTAAGQPNTTHSLKVTIYLTHSMNTTKELLIGANYLVQQQMDIIKFSLNIPPPPPIFSGPVQLSVEEEIEAVGLVVATALIIPIYFMWREMRKRAEEEEKRITL